MGWLDQLGDLLGQYVGGEDDRRSRSIDDDFDQVARSAPRGALARGLADTFRSDRTPPFPQMVSQMFGGADRDSRAGLLNTLIGAAGPGLLSQVLGGQRDHVTPEEAERIPPQAIEEITARAESQDPSIIDRVSHFFSQRPDSVRSLGAGGMAGVLSGLAQRRQQGEVFDADDDPYGDPADQQAGYRRGGVAPASQDPYGDPADQLAGYSNRGAAPASEDPYGDPADLEGVAPASEDPYGDPADQEASDRRGRRR